MRNHWTYGQYRFFRFLLGVFLLIHFTQLMPYASEVFSQTGVIPIAAHSPLMGIFPNPLAVWDNLFFINGLFVVATLLSVLVMIGRFDRIASILIVIILGWLMQRNPLINNPSLPMLGWMLLFHAAMPKLKPLDDSALSYLRARQQWQLPRIYFACAWIMLGLIYSYSGYTKLFSPSWVNGDTIRYVLENPLARDTTFRTLLLNTPPIVLKSLTWSVLYIELLFAPLALVPRIRPYLWTFMLAIQLGFLVCLNFADLTFPMILFHLLTFEPKWLHTAKSKLTFLYDGECGLCHRTVRFTLMEDSRNQFSYAPLQDRYPDKIPETMMIVMPDETVRTKSNAVITLLKTTGGIWYAIGLTLQCIPRHLRDWGYDKIAKIRHRLFAKPASICVRS